MYIKINKKQLSTLQAIALGQSAEQYSMEIGEGAATASKRVQAVRTVNGFSTTAQLIAVCVAVGTLKAKTPIQRPTDQELEIVSYLAYGYRPGPVRRRRDGEVIIADAMRLTAAQIHGRLELARVRVGSKTVVELVATCVAAGWVDMTPMIKHLEKEKSQ